MVIAYPLQTQKDYIELLYSLRSIEKHITLPYEILLLCSDLPEWVTNVTWIRIDDIGGKKQLSIKRKILVALEYSNEILFMNDDVYLLEDMSEFPYYYYGSLKSYSESGSRPLQKQLEEMGKEFKHFDGHYPLVYDLRFKEVSEQFTEDVIIKSMYCNYLGIEGISMPDNKLIKQKDSLQVKEFIKYKSSFSTGIYSLKAALSVLAELFPNKSKFEV